MSLADLIEAAAVKPTGEAMNVVVGTVASNSVSSDWNSAAEGARQRTTTADDAVRRKPTECAARRMFDSLLKPVGRKRLIHRDERRTVVAHRNDEAAVVVGVLEEHKYQQVDASHLITQTQANTEDRESTKNLERSVSRPQTVLSDRSALLQELGAFEARKALAFSRLDELRLNDAAVTISARELRLLHFLASVDHGSRRPQIACNVETKNFRLQWLLNPAELQPLIAATPTRDQETAHQGSDIESSEGLVDSITTRDTTEDSASGSAQPTSPHRKKDKKVPHMLNLLTMPTNALLTKSSRKPEENRKPLLNSPRSVLTCLRNGVQPMDLQEVPLDMLILELSSKGYSADMVRQRHQFQEEFRQNQLHALQEEYQILCRKLSLEQICTFFEFLALGDGLQAPEVVEVASPLPQIHIDADRSTHSPSSEHDVNNTDGLENVTMTTGPDVTMIEGQSTNQTPVKVPSKRLEVRVAGDATIIEAIRKIEDKAVQDKQKLTQILHQEIDNTKKKAETFAKEQKKNVEKQLAHQREVQQRQEMRQQIALAEKMEAEKKSQRRAQLIESAQRMRVEEILHREERSALAEQQAEAAMAVRASQRRERQDRKREAQLIRLKQAEEKVEEIEAQRRERFAEKQRLRDALLRQKEYLREVKREEDAIANEILQQRRLEIAQRSEEILTAKQQRAKDNTIKVEERLRQFASEKAAEIQFKRVVELRKELTREEVFLENEKRMQATIDSILLRRQAHEATFHSFQDEQEAKRAELRERDLQVLFLKEQTRNQHEQKHAYQLLLAAEECTRKLAKGEQLEDAREMQRKVLDTERESMNRMRHSALDQCKHDMQIQERANYLSTFRAASPGEAVTFKSKNIRAMAFMKDTLGKPLTAEEASAIQQHSATGRPHRKLLDALNKTVPIGSSSPMVDVSAMSAIRPATSMDHSMPK